MNVDSINRNIDFLMVRHQTVRLPLSCHAIYCRSGTVHAMAFKKMTFMKQYFRFQLIFCSILSLATQVTYAQLKCTTTQDVKGTIESCKHANGRVSTVRYWDNDRRNGSFEAFDAEGLSIAEYDLRRFAGHASVYADYYANGQVSKLEYSSAPDGGIQFWHIIMRFDEVGQLVSKTDLSQPDGHPVLHIPDELKTQNPTHIVVPAVPDVKTAPKFAQIVHLTNATGREINLNLSGSEPLSEKDLTKWIKPNESWVLDTVFSSNSDWKLDAAWLQLSPRDARKFECIVLTHTGPHWHCVISKRPRRTWNRT
jgi:hypothetical protein